MAATNPLAGVRAGIPALPTGTEVASYATYLEAQKAVDHLSDEGFPVQQVSIIGAGLRSVERVTGRLTYARVALAGAASGAYFGVFIGLLLTLFGTGTGSLFLAALLIGAAFGVLFGVISFALTRGRRDFSSVAAIVASRYTVLLAAEGESNRARSLLAGLEGVRPLPPVAPPAAVAPPPAQGPYGQPPAQV